MVFDLPSETHHATQVFDIRTFKYEYEPVNGREFLSRARKYAKRQHLEFRVNNRRGKGSHMTVYVGKRMTVVCHGEIRRPTCYAMLKQLGIPRDQF